MLAVRDITNCGLNEAMQRVASLITKDGLKPAYVLGILEGGRLPSQFLAAAFETEEKLLYYCRQRRTTGPWKARLLRLIRKLPTRLLDRLRSLELHVYGACAKHFPSAARKEKVDGALVSLIQSDVDASRVTESEPLFVVDDAVDTGKTMLAVVTAIQAAGIPRERIRTVAVVQTLAAPLLRVDYVAHSDVILRFPWSGDYRGRDENRR